MATAIPSPGPTAPAHVDGTLFFELFDAVAVWGWEWVLAELAEVARVRGDREVEVAMVVASSGLAENGDDGELVTQEPQGG